MLYTHPCKKFARKRFLHDTLDVTRQKYLAQSQCHKYRIISMSCMKKYRPANILLCGATPLDQCLCDWCENCEQLLRTFQALGMKDIPSNRYAAIESVVCSEHLSQFGSQFSFAGIDCLTGSCKNCGETLLEKKVKDSNLAFFEQNKRITWRQWMTPDGKKAPEKSQIKGTLRQAFSMLLEIMQPLKSHIFRANWNRNMFDYIRNNLTNGQVVQIFDFAMNFRNIYQDEVQSAYWDGTQMTIHAVINYFKCPSAGCSDIVSLTLAQISEDRSHDSFLAHAGHNAAFKYLAEIGVKMDLIIQFCDNCSSQYKSHRPFAELAQSPLNIIQIFFGEKHGKSQCDGFFGHLKVG